MDRNGIPSGLRGVLTALFSFTRVGLIERTDGMSEKAGDVATLRLRVDTGDVCFIRCDAVRLSVEGDVVESDVTADGPSTGDLPLLLIDVFLLTCGSPVRESARSLLGVSISDTTGENATVFFWGLAVGDSPVLRKEALRSNVCAFGGGVTQDRSGVASLLRWLRGDARTEGGVYDRGGVADRGGEAEWSCRDISSEMRRLIISADCFNELVRGGNAISMVSACPGLADDALSAVTLMTSCCTSGTLGGVVALWGTFRGRPELNARWMSRLNFREGSFGGDGNS